MCNQPRYSITSPFNHRAELQGKDLLSVYEVQQGGTARTPGRQALTETLQQYTTMMKAFLREGRFSVDLSTFGGGWLGASARLAAGMYVCMSML